MPDQARTGHTLRMYMVEALEAGVVSGAGDTRVHAVRVTLQGPVALCGAGPIAGGARGPDRGGRAGQVRRLPPPRLLRLSRGGDAAAANGQLSGVRRTGKLLR